MLLLVEIPKLGRVFGGSERFFFGSLEGYGDQAELEKLGGHPTGTSAAH